MTPHHFIRRKEPMNIDQILRETTANIADEYFQLPVAGREAPVYRERVNCYEHYYQPYNSTK